MTDTLNPKQKLFVQYFLELRDAKQAAIKAGYSAKTAATLGSRLANMPKIKKLIKAAIEREDRKMAAEAKKKGDNAEIDSIASHVKKAIENFNELKRLAMLNGEISSAIKAEENICKIRGLYAPAKQELEISNLKPPPTFEQLCAREQIEQIEHKEEEE